MLIPSLALHCRRQLVSGFGEREEAAFKYFSQQFFQTLLVWSLFESFVFLVERRELPRPGLFSAGRRFEENLRLYEKGGTVRLQATRPLLLRYKGIRKTAGSRWKHPFRQGVIKSIIIFLLDAILKNKACGKSQADAGRKNTIFDEDKQR